jgi:hypothetical protein
VREFDEAEADLGRFLPKQVKQGGKRPRRR